MVTIEAGVNILTTATLDITGKLINKGIFTYGVGLLNITGVIDNFGTFIGGGAAIMNLNVVAVFNNFNIFNGGGGSFFVNNNTVFNNYGTYTSGGLVQTSASAIINNFGTYNKPDANTLLISAGTTFNHSGNMNSTNGTFINGGTINAASGTWTSTINLTNNGVINTCIPIPMVINNPITANIPLGAICNDGNPSTTNDVITIALDCSSCRGSDPVPTISEWGIILLGLSMVIIGVVGIKVPKSVLS